MNNFTVLLVEKPQDPELLERLFERLQTAFKLSQEQARTLANKPAGPLLKATTEARAKQVAALYSSLGLEVKIVDLSAEAPRGSAVRGSAVRQVVAARSSVKSEGGLDTMPETVPDTASLGETNLSSSPVVGGAVSPRRMVVAASDNAATPLAASAVSMSGLPGVTPPSSDDNQSVTIRTTISAPSGMGAMTDLTPSASIGMRTRPTLDGSSVGGSGMGATPVSSATASPVETPVSRTMSAVGAAAPSSSSTSNTASPTSNSARTDADQTDAGGTMEEALGSRKGRSSLQTRVLLTTLLPLLALSAAILIFLSVSLPGTLRNLTVQGAKQLVISVGNSVNLEDLGNLDSNLTTLAAQPNVGFVSVKSSVVDQFKDKALENRFDLTINQAIQDYLNENPQLESFQWTDDAAGYELLRRQDTARSTAEMSSIKKASYDKAIAGVKNRPVNTYEIVRTGVYENEGRRTFGVADPNKAAFTVTVGTIINESQRTIRNTLLVASLFSLLLVLISAVLAIFTARRITRPILGLVDAANEISLGKLDNPVTVNTNDEIGDLARALERMRVSLGAALDRLRRRRR